MSLVNHPFTKILGGHPQAISLAAPMLEYKSLSELFQDFIKNEFGALDYESSDSATGSLRASLNISINHLKTKNPDAMNLFMFMGILPGGIRESDLSVMIEDQNWVSHKDHLT